MKLFHSPLAAIAATLVLLGQGQGIASEILSNGAASLETLEVQTQLLVPQDQPQADAQLNRDQLESASDQINLDIGQQGSPRAVRGVTAENRPSAEPAPTTVTIDLLP